MNRSTYRAVVVAVLLAGLLDTPEGRARAQSPAPRAKSAVVSPQPVFEPNRGQFDPQVRFVSRGRGYTLFLTSTEAVIALRAHNTTGGVPSSSSSVIRLAFDNARPGEAIGVEPQPGTVNYLIGNDPTKWHTGITTYASVRYEAVYPGIDLVYYSRENRHEYDLIVSPGADPSAIGMRVTGADRLALDSNGGLLLTTAHGSLTLAAPHVYQVVEGNVHPVAAHYSTGGRDGVVGFELGAFDRALPLVIDPQIVYGTFLGGTGTGVDQLTALDLDATGAPYIVGSSDNADFPTASPIQSKRGGSDAVVTKLSPDGRMIYSTYIGGSSFDGGQDIAVRADGTAYVLGSTTSSDFPTPSGFLRERRGPDDSFVLELNKEGTAITRSTLLGGSAADQPGGLALAYPADPSPDEDASARVFGDWLFVYGSTTSPDFPTVQPVQPNRAGDRDGFITIFDRQTLQPGFSTYAGEAGDNLAQELILNRARGDIYLSLYRDDEVGPLLAHVKPAEPPTGGVSRPQVAFQNFAGGYAISRLSRIIPGVAQFLERLSQNLKTAQANSCSPQESAAIREVQVTCAAARYFSRTADSRILATTGLEKAVLTVVMAGCRPVAPATTCTERAMVLFFDTDLSFIASVNFGGTAVGREFIPGRMVADAIGRFHFIGTTSDRTLPVVNPVQGTNAGSSEGFILTLDPVSGETSFLSYLGGSLFETMTDIAIDKDGNRWIVGTTQSTDFPATRSGVQPDLAGRIDGFVVKIAP